MLNRFLVVVLSASIVAGAACGGDSDAPSAAGDGAASPGAGAATTATQPARLSPAELGDAIFTSASQAIQQLTRLLDGAPPAAEARPKVAALKEATIQQLVALGRQYEALGTADRAQVDARVTAAYNAAANADWYKAYARLTTSYAADPELNKQIQSFNIITQYAFFDLLKKQEPAEAERLGIK